MRKQKYFWFGIAAVALFGLIAYLPLSKSWGFYYNDWHPVLGHITNTSLMTLFKADRPVLGLIYTFTVKVLGNDPFLWQLFAIALRIFTGFALYTILIQLWPKQKVPVTMMAALFVVYPGFMQQPIALTFSNHLIGLSIALLSISANLFGLRLDKRQRVKKIIFLLAAVGMAGLYLIIYEYMIGLEVVRWILIWYLLFPQSWFKLRKNFLIWLGKVWAYFLPLLGVLYFRLFMFESTRPTMNVDMLLESYKSSPFLMIQQVITEFFHALMNTAVFAYAVPLYERLVQIDFVYLMGGLLLSAAAILLFLYLPKLLNTKAAEADTSQADWAKEAVILGVLFTFVTLVPIVLTGRPVRFSTLLDRYTLQSSFGVTMMIVGLAYWVFRNKSRLVFISVFIALSMTFQFANGVYWKYHWDAQKDLFWQVYWRAPQIKPDTVILALQPDAYAFREDEDTYAPLNLIYYPDEGFIHIVSEVLADDTVDPLLNQSKTYRSYRTVRFKRDFSQALVISNTNPETCVHIIDGRHPELIQGEEALIKLAAPYSQIDQIMTDRQADLPPVKPFGLEPSHNWCYYYQKMELARQVGDWAGVVELVGEATSLGYAPSDISEWNPILEGYAGMGDWDSAWEIINRFRANESYNQNYCTSHAAYAEMDDFRNQIFTELCVFEE